MIGDSLITHRQRSNPTARHAPARILRKSYPTFTEELPLRQSSLTYSKTSRHALDVKIAPVVRLFNRNLEFLDSLCGCDRTWSISHWDAGLICERLMLMEETFRTGRSAIQQVSNKNELRCRVFIVLFRGARFLRHVGRPSSFLWYAWNTEMSSSSLCRLLNVSVISRV